MALCLQMDGVDDNLKVPSMTYNKIVLDAYVNSPPAVEVYVIDSVSRGSGGYIRISSMGAIQNNMNQSGLVLNTRSTTTGTIATAYTGGLSIFSRYDNPSRVSGKIFDIKIYNGTTLQVHYDMSTGTVQDQSGNGRHATLTGGTWVDDGAGGTPTATPETAIFATKQQLYALDAISFATRQRVYEGETASFATSQTIEEVSSQETVNFATKQVITLQETATFSTKQILFASDTSTFGTYLKIFQQETVEFAMEQIIDKGIPTPETVHFPIRVYINNFIVIEHDITGERFMKNSMPVNDSPDYVIPKGFHLSADQTHVPFIGKVTKWEANSKDPINTMQRWY